MKRLVASLVMIASAFAASGAEPGDPGLATGKKKLKADRIVIAHRGYWNTPGSYENSISAIENSMNFGIYGCEFDINLTSDDSILVVHGNEHPMRNGHKVQSSTYEVFRNLKLGNGELVPTLREYLVAGLVDPSTQYICEIKAHPTPEREDLIVRKTVDLVKAMKLEKRVEYISFSWHVCLALKQASPESKVYYLNGDRTPRQLKEAGLDGLDYSMKVMKEHPEWVDQAHELGLKVNIWTVNNIADMNRCLDWGTDYITTNNPVELKTLIGARNGRK